MTAGIVLAIIAGLASTVSIGFIVAGILAGRNMPPPDRKPPSNRRKKA